MRHSFSLLENIREHQGNYFQYDPIILVVYWFKIIRRESTDDLHQTDNHISTMRSKVHKSALCGWCGAEDAQLRCGCWKLECCTKQVGHWELSCNWKNIFWEDFCYFLVCCGCLTPSPLPHPGTNWTPRSKIQVFQSVKGEKRADKEQVPDSGRNVLAPWRRHRRNVNKRQSCANPWNWNKHVDHLRCPR